MSPPAFFWLSLETVALIYPQGPVFPSDQSVAECIKSGPEGKQCNTRTENVWQLYEDESRPDFVTTSSITLIKAASIVEVVRQKRADGC